MKLGRNDRCHCGSEKKYKHCHWTLDQTEERKNYTPDFSSFSDQLQHMSRIEEKEVNNPFLNYAERHESAHLLNVLTALQLDPQNHGKNVRIETIAKEVCKRLNTNLPGKLEVLKKAVEESYPYHYAEDPPEGLFSENTLFHGGNYTFMPGIASKSGDIFKYMSEAIFFHESELQREFINEIYQGVMLILELGQEIFVRGRIKGYSYQEADGKVLRFPDVLSDYSFSHNEIASLCLKKEIPIWIVDSLVTSEENPFLTSGNIDLNPLLYAPLIRIADRIYYPLISAQGITLCEYIINTALKYGCERKLLLLYYDTVWKDVLSSCNSMQWLRVSIVLPEMKTPLPIKEAIFQFDAYHLTYLLFKHASSITSKYDEERAFNNSNPDAVNNRINEVLRFYQRNPAFKDFQILVLVINCEIGRFDTLSFERRKYKEERIFFGAFEFVQLCKAGEWGRLSLLKYARCYRRTTELVQIIATDPIDAYSVYKSRDESFYLGDEPLPNYLNIAPGTGAGLYRQAKQKRNLHGTLGISEERIVYKGVESCSDYMPYYSTPSKNDNYNIVLETGPVPIWIESTQAPNKHVGLINHFAEAILFWLNRLMPKLAPVLTPKDNHPLVIQLELDSFLSKDFTFDTLEQSKPSTEFVSSYVSKRLHFFIPGNALKDLEGKTNQGERHIIKELLKAFSLLPEVGLEETVIDELLADLMPLNQTKMILIVDSQSNIQLDNRWLGISHFITESETSYLLDRQVSLVNYPGPIPKAFLTKEEKVRFCNHSVRKLTEHLQTLLNGFDKSELLERLIGLNESLTFKREFNKITVPSQIICFGQNDEYMIQLRKDDSKLVRTTLATRCTIELLASIASTGLRSPSLDEIDTMLAFMYEIINWGMISDSIHYELDNPDIGLLPSGRIGMSRAFYEEKLRPFSEANLLAEVESSLENFEDRFTRRSPTKVSDSTVEYWDKVDEAFITDWGVSLTDLSMLLQYAIYQAIELETSEVKISETQFINSLATASQLTIPIIEKGLSLLSLTERADYWIAPEGYKNEDVFPWKFNREFSFLRRPFILFKDIHEETVLIWGMRNIQAAAYQIQQLFLSGRLKYGGTSINKLLGERNNTRGAQFRQLVASFFKQDHGCEVWDYEVVIGPKGHLVCDKMIGDIDLLVYDRTGNCVYSIECKRTYQAKNAHEMKTELDRYLGRNGQTKNIQKHINRHLFLINNKGQLSTFIKSSTPPVVKSFILTSEVIPITYLTSDTLPISIISFPELKREGIKLLEGILNREGN